MCFDETSRSGLDNATNVVVGYDRGNSYSNIYAMHKVFPLSSPFARAALHAAAQAPLASGCRRPLAVTLDTPEKFARPPVTPPP